jgi:hypothetical protein
MVELERSETNEIQADLNSYVVSPRAQNKRRSRKDLCYEFASKLNIQADRYIQADSHIKY